MAILSFSFVLIVSLFFISTTTQAKSTIEASQRDIQENIQFRKSFGLDHQLEYVKKVIGENKGTEEFGVLLTEKENDQLKKRIENQNKFVENLKFFIKNQNLENDFAGVYVDQENGGKIHIGFKNGLNRIEILNAIKGMYFNPNDIIFEKTNLSQIDLDEIIRTLEVNLDKLDKLGISIVSAYTDLPNQKVVIYVKGESEEYHNILTRLLGNKIIVKSAQGKNIDHSRTDYYRPLLGGLRISNMATGSGCTSAYEAIKNGIIYEVTAGHCGSVGNWFSQGGLSFGKVSEKWYGGSVDAASIPTGSSNYSRTIYGNVYLISSYQLNTQDYVGQAICFSGASSNAVKCGKVTSTNVSGYWSNVWFSKLRGGDISNIPGDSGSPVYYQGQLRGVLKGSGEGQNLVYSHVDEIRRNLGLTPVIN